MKAALSVLRILAVLLVLAVALSACGSSGPVAIDSVTLQKDNGSGQPGSDTTTFSANDTKIYAKASLNQIASGLTGNVTWVSVDSPLGQNTPLPGGTVDLGNLAAANVITSSISPQSGLPAGKYQVVFTLNNNGTTLTKTGDFTVTQ